MKRDNFKIDTVFCLAKEMVDGNGEDCYYYDSADETFIVAAFDGCGGSGSKRYENYSGKTGAYVASRAVCGGVKEWFDKVGDNSELVNYVHSTLEVCKRFADRSGRMLGSLGKAFPTTAAITVGHIMDGGVEVTCFWAGDSRCYMLDGMGLHQLTADDLDVADAMENLTSDGVLTNVINASTPYEIHAKTLFIDHPCILFSATDGCFGYLKSPMEFEALITDSLVASANINEWKRRMFERMLAVAGDDFTLCLAAVGYRDFASMRGAFVSRNDFVANNFMNPNYEPTVLWESYKKDYSVFL